MLVWACMYHVHIWCLKRPKDSFGSLGNGVKVASCHVGGVTVVRFHVGGVTVVSSHRSWGIKIRSSAGAAMFL